MANARQVGLVVNLNESMLYCPIAGNGNVMRYPFQASDGYFYELRMLLSLFKRGEFNSPVTRQPINWVSHQKFLETSFDDSDIPNREPAYLSSEGFLDASKTLKDLLVSNRSNRSNSNVIHQRRPVSLEASPVMLGLTAGAATLLALLPPAVMILDDISDKGARNAVLLMAFLGALTTWGVTRTTSGPGFFQNFNASVDSIEEFARALGPHSSPS